MYSLVGDPKLACQLRLRDASRMTPPNDSIALRHCKGFVMRRGAAVEELQYGRNGNRRLPQTWSSLRLQGPLYDKDKSDRSV